VEITEDGQTLELVEEGFSWARTRIVGIGDTPLDAPTPCDQWDLRQLINHAVNAAATIAGVLSSPADVDAWGRDAVMPEEMANTDAGWPRPVERYDEVTSTITEAVRSDVSGQTFLMHGARQRPVVLARAVMFDSVVHGWDVAKATGQDPTIPDALTNALIGFASGLPDGVRGLVFGPKVELPASASPTDRLVALLGRQP
jgi:uncharacterized protein (TIGR03086 family)